jgi:alpha-glucosidase (family GH31 glycosyl hydrolase)
VSISICQAKSTRLNGEEPKIKMHQHPDALFDREYEEVILDLVDYRPCNGRFEVENYGENSVLLKTDCGDRMKVTGCAPDMLRIQAAPAGSEIRQSTTTRLGLVEADWPGAKAALDENEGEIQVMAGGLAFQIGKESAEVSVNQVGGDELISTTGGGFHFGLEEAEYSGDRFLSFFDLRDEHIFGFGGRTSHPDRTGESIDIFSIKAGRHQGDYGGFPVPFFMSTRGYGFFFNNPWPHVYFDMGKTYEDKWFLQAPGGETDIFVIYGPEFRDIIRSYTSLTGRIPFPKKWWFGMWASSVSFKTASQMEGIAERLRKESWPWDNLVLDGPWRGGPEFIQQYKANKIYLTNDINWHEDFGDGPELIDELHSKNFNVVLHLNSRNFKKETYEKAIPQGLLRRQGEEMVPKPTYPEGEKYFESHLKPRVEEGVDGWWTDHTDRVSGEIREGMPSRNLFGALWNRLIAEIMEDCGKPGHMSLSRGGGIGSQRYAIPWPGDTPAGMGEWFEQDLWFCMNAGLAGFPVTSVDMGGFGPGISDSEMDEDEAYESVFNADNICRRL